jgi:rhodanese-related sulfurtransferase
MRRHDVEAQPVEMIMNDPAIGLRRDYAFVRAALLERREIALIDAREEDPHAQAHPLFAANLPLARIELDAYAKLPRRDATIVTFDAGEGLAEKAAAKLNALGYSDVAVFAGGLDGWRAAGGEIFRDVNVPSKAFGELVEAQRRTPSLSAQEVKSLIDEEADIAILDARRCDEYHTMSIPTATSVPGAELVLRAQQLAPDPRTRIIVNCAGRTRSIIGAQSLIDAGLPNPVHALRNGTIGWTLAGQALERGASRRYPDVSRAASERAAVRARDVADRNGVARATLAQARVWARQDGRTTYFFDVRAPEEFEAGHLPGYRSTPGGQLVQETEMVAPVRGARIVLFDTHGARADMTASWLARMAWDVHVLDGVDASGLTEAGPWQAPLPRLPANGVVAADGLDALLEESQTLVIDLTSQADFVKGHIPGAWWALRSQFQDAVARLPNARTYVLTCGSGLLAHFAAPELSAFTRAEVLVLDGGNKSWAASGRALESGVERLASPPIDRYRRPYEGMGNAVEAMQAYLDWEFGLIEQLARDGTHHFRTK